MHNEVAGGIKAEYANAAAEAEQRLQDLHLQAGELQAEEEHAARRHLILVEKDAILTAGHQGQLSQEVLEELLADVDARLHELESDSH